MALGPLSRLTVPQGRLAARRDTREADHAPPLLTKLLPVLITSSPHILIKLTSSQAEQRGLVVSAWCRPQ